MLITRDQKGHFEVIHIEASIKYAVIISGLQPTNTPMTIHQNTPITVLTGNNFNFFLTIYTEGRG